jgi:hypothetical protein
MPLNKPVDGELNWDVKLNAALDYLDGKLLSVPSNIVPDTSNTRTLGTPTKRWADVFIGPNTIHITDTTLGTDADLSVTNGVLQVNGANQLQVGQLKFVDNTIESTTPSVNIQVGLTTSPGNITLNRNTTLASGKSLTFGDATVQTTAFAPTPTSFNPAFTDASGTVAGFTATGSYTRVGKLCFFRVYVDFNGYTNLGTGQYQITLPFASVATMTSRDGTLHNVGTSSIYHIAGILDTVDSTTVMKFYYSGSTTDLAWKYSTPVSWANNQTHFDISGVYQTV